jgi:NitT/TauT family transport system substrate-binding protein
MSVGDLQVVNLPPDRHRAAFVQHEVDAVVTSEPVRSEIVNLGGTELYSSASLPLELVGVMVSAERISSSTWSARRRSARRGGAPRKRFGRLRRRTNGSRRG